MKNLPQFSHNSYESSVFEPLTWTHHVNPSREIYEWLSIRLKPVSLNVLLQKGAAGGWPMVASN